jgi:hypothetical protein
MLLLCSRQGGKSVVAAALALVTALTRAPALILLLSPTLRQSGELFREKLLPLWYAMGSPMMRTKPTALELKLANGSRIVSLPESEEGIRGFSSVALLVIDEASRVGDDLYRAVRPMLAVSHGRLIALSTPFGQRGWFFDEWSGNNTWARIRITANQVPRIDADFLEEERKTLGERWYQQEYFCQFSEMAGSMFSPADVERSLTDDFDPLSLPWGAT